MLEFKKQYRQIESICDRVIRDQLNLQGVSEPAVEYAAVRVIKTQSSVEGTGFEVFLKGLASCDSVAECLQTSLAQAGYYNTSVRLDI